MKLPVFGLLLAVLTTTSCRAQTDTPAVHCLIPTTAAELQLLLRYTGQPLPLVSAHRGGAGAGYPENCLATFEHTLRSTWSLLEIDPRITRDGVIVVHHDTTLERTTTGTGRLADLTLAEVKTLRLKDPTGAVTEHRIPTLDEVFEWARGRTILVLDQKDASLQQRVDAITRHRAESFAMLIISRLDDAELVHELNPDIMMEFMIPTQEKLAAFESSGIPFSNIVAFVGHDPPEDRQLLRMLHERGVCCMAGTSRHLDREFLNSADPEFARLVPKYRDLIQRGVDILETDLPRQVGPAVLANVAVPAEKAALFQRSAVGNESGF